MKKDIILILILSVFICALGFSSELPKAITTKTFLISGKVLDSKNNELLAGVKVDCENCHKTVYTDLDGNFLIYLEVVSSENLTLEFSQIGYLSKTFNLLDIQANSAPLAVSLISE